MPTIISSNVYLTGTAIENNAGVIGYQNLVTPSTITATSETTANPITNAANPATAWGWVTGDGPAANDSITYSGTNQQPNPFDPSLWNTDADVTITNTTLENPSGSSVVGIAEQVGAGTAIFTRSNQISVNNGDKVYTSILVKQIDPYDISSAINDDATSTTVDRCVIDPSDGSIKRAPTNGSVNYTALGDGWALIQIEFNITSSYSTLFGDFRLRDGSLGVPPIGSQMYVQAVYFGKSSDYPANIVTAGEVPPQTITINTDGQEVDYIGIAKHNLNQIGLTITIKYNGVTVVPAQAVSDKQALLFLNNLASPDTIEIIIEGATTAPRIAVLYVGKSIRLQRNIYVGHTPITYGRQRTAINGVSENGQYLGEIVVREVNATSVNLQNLEPDWYRNVLDPFFKASPRVPCFWAWRPSKYPAEVGYCWVEGDPSMSNQLSNGMVQCSWNFKGIV